ncbi:MAG: hypothetical protein GYA58_08560 [Anaerolineaceae bacterium]|jgi:hypothetical protein|nr:hypothetical protein [Anaerolineaceae bacterium]
MNDKFLYENRPEPPKAFRDSLYAKLNQEESESQMFKKHLFQYSLAGLLIAVVLLFTISAPVRANVANWIKQIAGFNVSETTESPLAKVTEMPSMITVLTPLPVSEIKNAPFNFAMPQYLPSGFVLSQDFAIAQSKQWVLLHWSNNQAYEISMLVEIYDKDLMLSAAQNSAVETSVNGQPALLIRGGWTSDSVWDENRRLELEWLKDGLRYDLQYYRTGDRGEIIPFDDSETSARLDELMQIAESIK